MYSADIRLASGLPLTTAMDFVNASGQNVFTVELFTVGEEIWAKDADTGEIIGYPSAVHWVPSWTCTPGRKYIVQREGCDVDGYSILSPLQEL